MIYSLGTDISKDKFDACLQSYRLGKQTHQVIARKTIKNTPSGWARRTENGGGKVPRYLEHGIFSPAAGMPWANAAYDSGGFGIASIIQPLKINKYKKA